MPTIPPAEPPAPDPCSVQIRQVAESFGTDAERYDRARPRYPQALVERIVAASPGPDVLDVGCGTGIAARQLQAAGCRVLGVDPDARMADLARKFGLEVEVSKIEDWDPAGRTFDAVTAGQAWHWIDPVAGAAKAGEALRPGGVLAIFWNASQPPAGLARSFAEIYQRLLPDSPFRGGTGGRPAVEVYTQMADRAAGGVREAGGFGDFEQWRFSWEHRYSRDEWVDQIPTHGPMNQLAPDRMAEIQAAVGAAIDAVGGSLLMEFNTVAVKAARTPPTHHGSRG
jgi:SAM-dependent methyltransferase